LAIRKKILQKFSKNSSEEKPDKSDCEIYPTLFESPYRFAPIRSSNNNKGDTGAKFNEHEF
jgi:hypothetical protein